MSTTNQHWSFNAVDTWFFRESRPMEAVGGAQLQSVFPPPARTLVGAIRTAIGEAMAVDWTAYGSDAGHPLRAVMGDAQSLGPLRFVGPTLTFKNERLYPVPLALLSASQPRNERAFTRLVPGEAAVACDIGRVRLPTKKSPLEGAKPLEGAWLTPKGLNKFLDGHVPDSRDVVDAGELFQSEDRLGIGRDAHRGSVEEGLLYQTRHVRPQSDVAVGMLVEGLSAGSLPDSGVARLGAEGRLATWSRRDCSNPMKSRSQGKRVVMVILTPTRFLRGWLPDGFEQVVTEAGTTAWEGSLGGVPLRLVSAVVGKTMREGGWDMVSAAPRAVENLVPGGSCYFFERMDASADGTALAGVQVGQDTQWGRGEVTWGNW